jgi:molecular chaperone DnaK (HSP70)
MDASLIRIKQGNEFQVISNVGDASFGLRDIDDRILEYLLDERDKRTLDEAYGRECLPDDYVELVKLIKKRLAAKGAALIDLNRMTEASTAINADKSKKNSNEINLRRSSISGRLCKDIYEWALAYMHKSVAQAQITSSQLEEIIFVGDPNKMPGFFECINKSFPGKQIRSIGEEQLAVGAALAVRRISRFRQTNFLTK